MTVIYNISKLFIIYLFDCLNCFRIIIISRNFEKFFMVFKRREKKKKKRKESIHSLSREIKILPRMINGTGLLYIFHRRGFVERYRYSDFIYDRKV